MRERRQFAIQDCLGRGAFGEVYLAQMRQPGGLETRVAVKVLREDLASGSDAVLRLRDEGRLLARLAHPTILRVLDLALLDGRVALITEYVEGADLGRCWTSKPPLGLRASLQVIGRVAAALQVAHGATGGDGRPLGLVHRDIKPSNVRIGRHGQVKLLDFGIAWSRAENREARTDSDLVVGSLHYMAPERFVSRRAAPAWDVFGLGAMLYEGLAEQRFLPDGLGEAARLSTRRDRYIPWLAGKLDAVGETVSGEVTDLLRDLLAFVPAERPSAAEVLARCEALADEVGGASLGQWCRAHDWAAPDAVDGSLEGRTLTEGTLDLPRENSAEVEGEPVTVRGAVPTLETVDPKVDIEPPTLPPNDSTAPETRFIQDVREPLPSLEAEAPSSALLHPSEAPTEEVPPPPRSSEEVTQPTTRQRGPSAVRWAYYAGGLLLAFAAVLAAVGAFATWVWLHAGP